MSIFDSILKKGIRFSVRFGRIFDPRYQVRTSAMDDLLKKDEEKTIRQLDEAFGIDSEKLAR